MLDLREAGAFKQHLRDLLVQTKAFASQDDADQFAGDAAQKRANEQVCSLYSWAFLGRMWRVEGEGIVDMHAGGQSCGCYVLSHHPSLHDRALRGLLSNTRKVVGLIEGMWG